MTTSRNNPGSRDLWKSATLTLAAFLSGVIISGGGYILRAPTRAEVDVIRDRQNEVLQRLAAIDTMLEDLNEGHEDFQNRAGELERLLREHVLSDANK